LNIVVLPRLSALTFRKAGRWADAPRVWPDPVRTGSSDHPDDG
jgi:hypothetical protein